MSNMPGKTFGEIFKYIESSTENKVEINKKVKQMMSETKSLETDWNKANMSLRDYMDKYTSIGKDNGNLTRLLSGFNHRNLAQVLPSNKNMQGYAFFTRPQLALNKENLLRDPLFVNLLNKNKYSIHRFIRCTLDPRLAFYGTGVKLATNVLGFKGYRDENGVAKAMGSLEDEDLSCPLLDNTQLFTPLLTNTLERMSGWPDESLPTYSSKPNVAGGLVTMADGEMIMNGEFDISCTFTNTQDMPILLLIYHWVRYCSNVVRGSMIPYPDILYNNELDYTTRIYRLVMDQSNTYVTMISACGAAFPTAIDIGKYFEYDKGKPYTDLNRSVTINFKCVGARYMDPRMVDAFNKTVCMGEPMLLHLRLKYLNGKYELPKDFPYAKVPYNLLNMFNYNGLPFINYNTMELEWWINTNSPIYKDIKDLIARGLDKKGDEINFENNDAHIPKNPYDTNLIMAKMNKSDVLKS